MRRFLVPLIAAGVLVGAGAVYAASRQDTTEPRAGDATTDTVATERAAPDDTRDRTSQRGGSGLVTDTLDGLVADGTITHIQADEIAAALQAKREEVRAGIQTREDHESERSDAASGLGDLLEDGVIDAAELETLPESHPLRDPDGPAADFLGDGRITQDEIDQMGETATTTPGHGDDKPTEGATGTTTDALAPSPVP
ncbi:hypothetical protein BH24ACT7_BH24ACT7_19570 [soil metagenome]